MASPLPDATPGEGEDALSLSFTPSEIDGCVGGAVAGGSDAAAGGELKRNAPRDEEGGDYLDFHAIIEYCDELTFSVV